MYSNTDGGSNRAVTEQNTNTPKKFFNKLFSKKGNIYIVILMAIVLPIFILITVEVVVVTESAQLRSIASVGDRYRTFSLPEIFGYRMIELMSSESNLKIEQSITYDLEPTNNIAMDACNLVYLDGYPYSSFEDASESITTDIREAMIDYIPTFDDIKVNEADIEKYEVEVDPELCSLIEGSYYDQLPTGYENPYYITCKIKLENRQDFITFTKVYLRLVDADEMTNPDIKYKIVTLADGTPTTVVESVKYYYYLDFSECEVIRNVNRW